LAAQIEETGLAISHVRKAFRSLVAVDDLTFRVPKGSMFGLLGANGAGKTTTLRMVLSILSPDAGTITWDGRLVSQVPRPTFGYLPEERGLYAKMKTGAQLVFLAGLNNLTPGEATRRAREWLARVGLADAWSRKVEELSKGNQQKVQVLAALLHDPALMLLDEPFSGLDPINTDVLRDTLLQRQHEGRTIIFSSHRLEQVEELCDHVAIIHKGRLLKAGPLTELKRSTGRKFVEVAFVDASTNGYANGKAHGLDAFLSSLAPMHVQVTEQRSNGLRLELLDGARPDEVLRAAMQSGPGSIRRFEIAEPSLQEIFLAAVLKADPGVVEQLALEGVPVSAKVLTEG
jgi:ABC-2 type transport system ATP-binding protein